MVCKGNGILILGSFGKCFNFRSGYEYEYTLENCKINCKKQESSEFGLFDHPRK
jgi:hypothetical protein